MLRLDRLCVIVLIFNLVMLLPGTHLIKLVDELTAFTMLFLAVVDCIINRNFQKYKGVFVVIAILLGYLIYSILFLHYNTPKAIASDLIIQIKPFLPFFVVFAIRPQLTHIDCVIIKTICVINSILVFGLACIGEESAESFVFHVAYLGVAAFISSVFYYFCCLVENDGKLSKANLFTVLLILAPGILCFRSKFYVESVLMLFFLFVYKPGMTRSIKPKHIAGVLLILVAVVMVSWDKFSYYFLYGNNDTFDPILLQSYARPVLYVTAGLILIQHIPFGTGLASFATFASGSSYSGVYYEYGIDKVYGLQPEFPDFICDAYYPSLAQFGIVGIILFIAFWRWLYKIVRQYLRIDSQSLKHFFIVGAMMVCFIMVENTTGTIFNQSPGLTMMMGLGVVCSHACNLAEAHASQTGEVRVKRSRIKRLRLT